MIGILKKEKKKQALSYMVVVITAEWLKGQIPESILGQQLTNSVT